MIELLKNIFIAVLYFCGIGFFGFFGALLWVMMIRIIMESKHD